MQNVSSGTDCPGSIVASATTSIRWTPCHAGAADRRIVPAWIVVAVAVDGNEAPTTREPVPAKLTALSCADDHRGITSSNRSRMAATDHGAGHEAPLRSAGRGDSATGKPSTAADRGQRP